MIPSQESNRYRSTTNTVFPTFWRGNLAICKQYKAQAMGNVLYPLMRSGIEAEVLAWLENLVGFEPLTPRLLHWNSFAHLSIMSIVPGEPLRDLDLDQWPPSETFESLGQSLAQVEQVSLAKEFTLSERFKLARIACGNIISQHKGIPVQLDKNRICLSLGDVATQNILWDGLSISLLDFEFAHLGSIGKDAGVLGGELMAYETVCGLPQDFRQKLLLGYKHYSGNGCYFEKWSNLAFPYHRDKQNRLILRKSVS